MSTLSKYSASRLKSTAAATATSYLNRIKLGMQDSLGLAGTTSSSTLDKDDDEETAESSSQRSSNGANSWANEAAATLKRCGARALVNAFR